ncbi:MAG: conjugative transfer signal peptidase TraF [Candidatus Velthaea sp.]|jgi:conjugative transfer signal peptidase TraF
MNLFKRLSRPATIALVTLLSVNLTLIAAYTAGLRINRTASMPEGLYRIVAYHAGPIARGTVVVVCPSANVLALAAPRHYLDPGPCPGNVEPLLKHVAAIAGDEVELSEGAVSVDGAALEQSGRLARDCAGRPLSRIPAGRYRIANGTVWLYAPVARSWDSRYFGPQPASGIVGIAQPVLIVGTGQACAS